MPLIISVTLVDCRARHFDVTAIVERLNILAELLDNLVGVLEGKRDTALSDNFEVDYRMVISARLLVTTTKPMTHLPPV